MIPGKARRRLRATAGALGAFWMANPSAAGLVLEAEAVVIADNPSREMARRDYSLAVRDEAFESVTPTAPLVREMPPNTLPTGTTGASWDDLVRTASRSDSEFLRTLYSSIEVQHSRPVPSADGRFILDRIRLQNPLFPADGRSSESQHALVIHEVSGEGVWLVMPQSPATPESMMQTAVWSPVGSRLAFLAAPAIYDLGDGLEAYASPEAARNRDRRGWALRVWDSATGETRELAPRGWYYVNRPRAPAWSSDGRRLLFTTALEAPGETPRPEQIENLYMADVETGDVRRLLNVPRPCYRYWWTEDDRSVIAESGAVLAWDAQRRLMCPVDGAPDPNGLYWLIDPDSGERQLIMHTPQPHGYLPVVSPDLRWAAYVEYINARQPDAYAEVYGFAIGSSPELIQTIRSARGEILDEVRLSFSQASGEE